MTIVSKTAIRRAAELAHVLFVQENWTWHDSTTPPTIDEIEDAYRRLGKHLGRKWGASYSGRLGVRSNDVDGVEYSLELGSTGYGEEYPA